VAAAPGSVEAPSAAGTNQLLRDGAHVLADPADVLDLLGLGRTAPSASCFEPEPDGIGDDERLIWRALAAPAPDVDTLAERAGLPARRCVAALGTLELRGHVATDLLGEVRRGT
jgi:DNA processing protein